MDFLTPLLMLGTKFLGNMFGNQENTTQSTDSLTRESGGEQTSMTAATTGTSNTTNNSTSTQTGSQSQNTNQTSTTTGNQSNTGTSNTGTTSTGNQATTGNSTEQQNTNQTGNVSRLDDGTKDLLTQNIQSLLSSAGGRSSTVDARLNEVAGQGSDFDPAAFVNGVMQQATVKANGQLESDIAKIGDSTGGSASGNSAAALLKNRVVMDQDANLGGIRANATATAAQIEQANNESKTNQLTALAATGQNDLSTMLGNLLNAGQTETTATIGNTTGSNTQNQNTSQNQNVNQSTSSNQNNSQVVGTNTAATGTSTNKTVGTETGTEKSTQNQTQNQKTATTQQSQVDSDVSQKTAKQNWSDFFSGIGDIFKTQF